MSKIKLWENTHFDKIIAVYNDGTEEEIGYINDNGDKVYYGSSPSATAPKKFHSDWNQRQYDAYKQRQKAQLAQNGRSPDFGTLLYQHNRKVLTGVSDLMRQAQARQQAMDKEVLKSKVYRQIIRQNPAMLLASLIGNEGYSVNENDQNPVGFFGYFKPVGVRMPYKFKDGSIVNLTYSDTLKFPYYNQILLGNLKKATEYKRYINKTNGTVIYLTDEEANSVVYRSHILLGTIIKDPLEKHRDNYWNALIKMMNDPLTKKALEEASEKTGMKMEDLMIMALMESTGNRLIGKNAKGYTGLMQMGPDAVKDVIKFDNQITYRKVDTDVNINALAGAYYMKKNKEQLINNGYEADVLHLYLTHQQGFTGFNNLMRTLKVAPNTEVTYPQKVNIAEGGYTTKAGAEYTQKEFYDGWNKKVKMIKELVNEYLNQ